MSGQTGYRFETDQFRMSRLQVYNWGTFSDAHDIPIAARGFLIVGRSGAGKSTLLDAISALLVPPRWVDFNAAAREAERKGRDRNLVSYIRGAWAEQKDDASGEIATRYLRPGTTWSALALTYENTGGQYVTLLNLFWLRGGGNALGDVKRWYLVFNRPLDLSELDDFAQSNLNPRKLRQSFPQAYISAEFRSYRERFCHLLGIASEKALHLLHKTQSAKNLGDLNTFMRDFMLDKPETFAVAERLVSEFEELDAAHKTVLEARRQVQTLSPAREQYQHRRESLQARDEHSELLAGIDRYTTRLRMDLLGQRIERLRVETEGLEGEVRQKQAALERQQEDLRALEQQHRQAGGEQVDRWQAQLRGLQSQREERLRKLTQAQLACKALSREAPSTPRQFAALRGEAQRELENWQHGKAESRARRDKLILEKGAAEGDFKQTTAEVRGLERQPSNIPAPMLALREEIAAAIGVREGALPFVGELLEVKQSAAAWRGAIERVSHGFALSLLVDERHYAALSGYIDGRHLGRRLVYYRVADADGKSADGMDRRSPMDERSLVRKLEIKKDCAQAEWLMRQLRGRFDYACVDSMQDFRRSERALTMAGQIKHNRNRHEKDDRGLVDDRRRWVLGFDNREKLALYREQAQELGARISALDEEIRALSAQDAERDERVKHCQTLLNLRWQELDAASSLVEIEQVERQIHAAQEGNTRLKDLAVRVAKQEEATRRAEMALRQAHVKHEQRLGERQSTDDELAALASKPEAEPLSATQQEGLARRFGALPETPALGKLDEMKNTVERGLNKDHADATRAIDGCERVIEKQFDEFTRNWPAEAGGLDANIESAGDFFTKLERLETEGLPEYERRFFELLANQSHQNLAELSTHISSARKEILERMELVNDSLRQAPFNRDAGQTTYLQIEVSDRHLPIVREFRQEIKQALSHAWEEDRELAERRFLVLRNIVERLSKDEPEHRRWRETALDVRLHIEFIGREVDENGDEREVYRSGSGKSGGQRQKLATTCLAAALRYQLGGNERGLPQYAPVALDEAFDKADNEFTALAMDIFANFGFQMLVATPLKSVMTLEPFIGGACFVDISERHTSTVLMVEYDEKTRRLDLESREDSDEIPA